MKQKVFIAKIDFRDFKKGDIIADDVAQVILSRYKEYSHQDLITIEEQDVAEKDTDEVVEDMSNLSVAELKVIADDLNLEYPGNISKVKIIELIQSAQQPTEE